jgi:quinohemoprotein ethanol dehydrogenase
MAADSTGTEPGWKHDDEVIAQEMTHYSGHLAAWDPVAQREVWRVDNKGLWLGGTLTTAGNLVFEGSAKGELTAYRADTGKQLWSIQVQTAIIAPPISYEVGGDQYIAVMVGWGGSMGLTQGPAGVRNHIPNNLPRVLAFKLNGDYTLPPVPLPVIPPLNPPPDTASAAQIDAGRTEYTRCARCHGSWATSPGDVPDLRYSSMVYNRDILGQVVKKGLLRSGGMPMFGPEVSDQALDDMRAYIIHQANEQVARNKAEQQQ